MRRIVGGLVFAVMFIMDRAYSESAEKSVDIMKPTYPNSHEEP